VTPFFLLFALVTSAPAADRLPATLDALDVSALLAPGQWTRVATVPLGKTPKAIWCSLGSGCELRGPKGNKTDLAFDVTDRGIRFRHGSGVDQLKLGTRVISLPTGREDLLRAFRALTSLDLR
jgi:hypothetical protein